MALTGARDIIPRSAAVSRTRRGSGKRLACWNESVAVRSADLRRRVLRPQSRSWQVTFGGPYERAPVNEPCIPKLLVHERERLPSGRGAGVWEHPEGAIGGRRPRSAAVLGRSDVRTDRGAAISPRQSTLHLAAPGDGRTPVVARAARHSKQEPDPILPPTWGGTGERIPLKWFLARAEVPLLLCAPLNLSGSSNRLTRVAWENWRSSRFAAPRVLENRVPRLPTWRNWQTRWTQNPVTARSCGFDPLRRHQQTLVFCSCA